MQDIADKVFRAHKKDFCMNCCKLYKTNRAKCKKIRKMVCYPNMRKTVITLLNKFNITEK